MSNDKLPIKERYFEGDDSFTKDYVKSLDTNDVRFWDAYAKAIDQYVSAKKEKLLPLFADGVSTPFSFALRSGRKKTLVTV